MESVSNERRVILVSGATGQQGGTVARNLLERGFAVRALTRDTEKAAARELAEIGAEIVSGDLEDRGSIERVLDGVYGVFSVQQFIEAASRARSGRACCSRTQPGRPGSSTSFTAPSGARTGRRASRTSRASGRWRSTCGPAACLTRCSARLLHAELGVYEGAHSGWYASPAPRPGQALPDDRRR